METTTARQPEQRPEPIASSEARKKPRKSRQSAEGTPRFFLSKAGAQNGRPELGEEAGDENQALIKAFQQSGVIHVLMSYRVEAEIQEGTPVLVKRPLQKQQGQ